MKQSQCTAPPDFPASFVAAIEAAVMQREGRPERVEIRFRCPVEGHPDEHPSARWNSTKAVWCCDVCKEGGGAVELADLLDVPRPEAVKQNGRGRRIVATYDYRDDAGPLLYQTVRYDPKDFRQRRPEPARPGKWIWNLEGVQLVPYRLPELRASTGIVYVCEGEKDVEALRALGLTAATTPMGAGKWRDEYAEHFRDRKVVLLPDNDEPGRAHMATVAASLAGVASSVLVVKLPDLPEKGDVTDWIAAGGTAAELLTLRLWAQAAEKAKLEHQARPSDGNPNGPVDAALGADALGNIDGTALLEAVHAFLGRFVAYPSENARVAHTLWIAHAHLMDVWESTPRVAFLSPEPASGKTRALEVTEPLVPNPIEAINVSAAYLFRKVGADAGRPTILFDEIDTVFGPKAREHEDVRGLLNAGHRKGAAAGRCVVHGKTVVTEELPAYCAVALAGLGDLPDTILTRSVVVRMRRRAPHERIEPYRRRIEQRAGHALRDRLAAWAAAVKPTIGEPWPELPVGVEDRDADVWEALVAVADAAGGAWPERARVAAVAFVAAAKDSTPSLGIRLLTDLRTIFGNEDMLSTEDILAKLHALDEAPWAELVGGKPLNARGLAQRLGPYGVKSKTVRIGGATPKGYRRDDLGDAWTRYLPSSPGKSATSATCATPDEEPTQSSVVDGAGGATHVADVADRMADVADDDAATMLDVAHVADVALSQGRGGDDDDAEFAAGAPARYSIPAECRSRAACPVLGPCESGWCGRAMTSEED